jgi:hypothetical protein
VPALADQGLYIGSESSFYRVLHQAGQCQRRGRARPPQQPRTVPRLRADGPNQVWSWDITYLPGVNYVGGSRQLRRRVPPCSPPAMAGGGDSEI